jgi:large subunit ribosomal protein L21
MIAVIDDRGRQYRAQAGERLTLDRLDAEVGATLERSVLLTADGDNHQIGTPTVAGVTATLKVLAPSRGKKGTYGFFRRRKDSRRRVGFRHDHTTVEVVSIG